MPHRVKVANLLTDGAAPVRQEPPPSVKARELVPNGSYLDETGVRISERTGKPVRAYRKRKSLRAYRREIDEIRDRLLAGEISPKTAQAFVQATQAASEIYLAERKLQIAGIEDIEAPDHMLGDDGGSDGLANVREPELHRVRRRTGIGSDGNPIDETEVEIEGGREVTAKIRHLIDTPETDDL